MQVGPIDHDDMIFYSTVMWHYRKHYMFIPWVPFPANGQVHSNLFL